MTLMAFRTFFLAIYTCSSIVVYCSIVMVATTQVVVDSLVLAISVATIVLLPALVARVDVLDVESP